MISIWVNVVIDVAELLRKIFLGTHVHQPYPDMNVVPRPNCLILFYKIINNLAMVPIEKADGHTRKKHNMKFRHIDYNMDPYGQSFFSKCISAWNGLAQEIAEANTLNL